MFNKWSLWQFCKLAVIQPETTDQIICRTYNLLSAKWYFLNKSTVKPETILLYDNLNDFLTNLKFALSLPSEIRI